MALPAERRTVEANLVDQSYFDWEFAPDRLNKASDGEYLATLFAYCYLTVQIPRLRRSGFPVEEQRINEGKELIRQGTEKIIARGGQDAEKFKRFMQAMIRTASLEEEHDFSGSDGLRQMCARMDREGKNAEAQELWNRYHER